MGYIYVYTGNGAGKTTNALGLALRTVGHKQKAIIIQFLKWWKNIGEYKVKEMLEPYYEIYQFGRPAWLNLEGEEEKEVEINGQKIILKKKENIDKKLCEEALKFAKKKMMEEKPRLLVLDEINLAMHSGLLDVKKVLEFLKDIPENTSVVLTGRYAPKEIIEAADVVNEIVEVKFPKKMITTEGIQY